MQNSKTIVRGFVKDNDFYYYCHQCKKFHKHGVDIGRGKNKTKYGHRQGHCLNFDNYFIEEFSKGDLLKMKQWIDIMLKKYK